MTSIWCVLEEANDNRMKKSSSNQWIDNSNSSLKSMEAPSLRTFHLSTTRFQVTRWRLSMTTLLSSKMCVQQQLQEQLWFIILLLSPDNVTTMISCSRRMLSMSLLHPLLRLLLHRFHISFRRGGERCRRERNELGNIPPPTPPHPFTFQPPSFFLASPAGFVSPDIVVITTTMNWIEKYTTTAKKKGGNKGNHYRRA